MVRHRAVPCEEQAIVRRVFKYMHKLKWGEANTATGSVVHHTAACLGVSKSTVKRILARVGPRSLIVDKKTEFLSEAMRNMIHGDTSHLVRRDKRKVIEHRSND